MKTSQCETVHAKLGFCVCSKFTRTPYFITADQTGTLWSSYYYFFLLHPCVKVPEYDSCCPAPVEQHINKTY